MSVVTLNSPPVTHNVICSKIQRYVENLCDKKISMEPTLNYGSHLRLNNVITIPVETSQRYYSGFTLVVLIFCGTINLKYLKICCRNKVLPSNRLPQLIFLGNKYYPIDISW